MSNDEFATRWLDGADALQKLSGDELETVTEFSGFVKKLSKLEAKFGVELSQLIAKDGKKCKYFLFFYILNYCFEMYL
jgi:phage-related holin